MHQRKGDAPEANFANFMVLDYVLYLAFFGIDGHELIQ